MATIWLTYAWADNEHGDVDYLAQELANAGVDVKLDRWNIQAGLRLWDQIETFIQSEGGCDAWVIYATVNSLGSEPCKEEFAYALDRALNSRGNAFPVIGLFPASVDAALVPAAIRVRLYVSLTEADWKERIKAAAEGRGPVIARPTIDPYYFHVYDDAIPTGGRYMIEVRPRAGTWSPFIAAVPFSESDNIRLDILHGPSGRIPNAGMLVNKVEGYTNDNTWAFVGAQNEATPTQSYYVCCNRLPSKLLFGIDGGAQYVLTGFK